MTDKSNIFNIRIQQLEKESKILQKENKELKKKNRTLSGKTQEQKQLIIELQHETQGLRELLDNFVGVKGV